MTIYSFWMYDRHCNCIYSREYTNSVHTQTVHKIITPSNTTPSSPNKITGAAGQTHKVMSADALMSKGLINVNNENHLSQLLFGMIFSLRKLSSSLSESATSDDNDTSFLGTSLDKGNSLKSFHTLNYKCHFFETLTGLKLLLLTDPQCRDLQADLDTVYQVFYINDVVRNQLMPVDFKEGEYIQNEKFIKDVDSYWSSLPEFVA